jgi:hypothetical protein
MRFFSRRPSVALLLLVLCTAQSPAQVPTEPPPPVCSSQTVVSSSVGTTLRHVSAHERIVAIVWHLSDHHTYVSQTGDDPSPTGAHAMKASSELLPHGTKITLCKNSGDAGPYPYIIRTKDGTNRAAKRIDEARQGAPT